MADCNYAIEGWEWENIFTSSLLEQDITWHGVLSEPETVVAVAPTAHAIIHPSCGSSFPSLGTLANSELLLNASHEGDSYSAPVAGSDVIATNTSDGSLDSSGYNHETPVSSHHLPSETSLGNPSTSASLSKKKKRDPRLVCPNYLAGRVPCSCPEEDELEEGVEVDALVKRRSKVAARCQVPSCGGDISQLKGYHQRHRVCLACANSPEVMLKDQPHRYCQQCGKFHRLSDFDEGKRSCRRKLERHNRRRRRRPVEDEGEAQDGEVPLPGIDTDGSNMQSPPEEAATQGAQTATASIKQGSGTKTGRTQQRKEGTTTKEDRKTAASIKQSSDTVVTDTLQKREVEGISQDISNPIVDDQRTSDDSSASVLRFEEDIISSNKSKIDEHSLLNTLMRNANEGAEEGTRNVKQLHALKSEAPRTSYLSTSQRKCTAYVSPCPTGRISFKLYDWNPADFPRRLRQQIFEWLANMPVELESYVRSGCIILTFFVTMPQLIWDKVLADWKGEVQTFILESETKLLGTGQLMTQMVEENIHLKDGKVTSGNCKDLLAPFLVDLYPRSLEAGCVTQIYVSGFNFSGARFLISFGEHYVECSDWESVDNHQFAHQTVRNSFSNLEVQKVTVFLPDSQNFGLAYVEVESAYGVSNFMPVLVADKAVCLEINALRLNCALSATVNCNSNTIYEEAEVSRSQYSMDTLTDLGWALKYMNKQHHADKTEVREIFMKRVQSLLMFSLEHCCHAVTQRLVQTALSTLVTQDMNCVSGSSEGLSVWNTSNTSKEWKDALTSGGPALPNEVEQGSFIHKSALLANVDCSQSIDKPSQTKGLRGPRSAGKQLHLVLQSVQLEDSDTRRSFLPSMGLRDIEVPLLEERIPILEEGWGQKGCWTGPLSWQRKPLGFTGTCARNRKFCRVLIATVSIVTVCTGMCFMLQYPHEVTEMSMSLRRCLWGSSDFQHV
eukprot:c20988_g1_i1 orf=716-3577(+)